MKLKMLALLPLLALPLISQADMPMAASPTAKAAASAAKAKAVTAVKSKKAKKAKPVAAAAKEHWVCPMHDGGESDHAGKCPKCGMDLVKEKS